MFVWGGSLQAGLFPLFPLALRPSSHSLSCPSLCLVLCTNSISTLRTHTILNRYTKIHSSKVDPTVFPAGCTANRSTKVVVSDWATRLPAPGLVPASAWLSLLLASPCWFLFFFYYFIPSLSPSYSTFEFNLQTKTRSLLCCVAFQSNRVAFWSSSPITKSSCDNIKNPGRY